MPTFASILLFAALTFRWIPQAGNTTSGLRGLSVVSDQVVWASGSHGAILRTIDGGEHWTALRVPGGDALDFRDVVAFDATTAFLMSSGTGDASRIYRTTDGGQNWSLSLSDPDKAGFFDALKFWDRRHGILLGDPVDGKFTILITVDAGLTWKKATQPDALKDEGAFAASGTCLTLLAAKQAGILEAWFGSGGPLGGRVFHTRDAGQSWSTEVTPLSGKTAASGIFSLKFLDGLHGIAVGGDYQLPSQTDRTLAITSDGGKTWSLPPAQFMGGFRSAIGYVKEKQFWLTVGTSGSDYSSDGGLTWTHLSDENLNAVSTDGRHVWAVGPKGTILKLATGK